MKTKGTLQWVKPPVLPAEFGSTPIPEGTVRFNHYTTPGAAESIASEGLRRSFSEKKFETGGTESPQVFASAGRPKPDQLHSGTTVEGFARNEQLDVGNNYLKRDQEEHVAHLEGNRSTITFHGDVPKDQIIAVHTPEHSAMRLLGDRRYDRSVNQGDYDFAAEAEPRYGPALELKKVALAMTAMSGGQFQGRSFADSEKETP